ncbi:RTA1 like protein-domain-containing protein [Dactylonectria estremocensis]|uniref:RTA1 like protein-domain-containing protein n=1 Tax=Dactylonectria estremocensis TaxID=1079267 RepID=A0A9P9IHC7_9HYPO|nr:RTA1 like protein-domain-containing protein [Dactylonectria estremocensis]
MAGGYGSVDTSNCTEVTPECPVSATLYGDYFSTGGCAFFVAAYAILIFSQLSFGWRSKTWSYTAYLFVGSVFELIGYISRVRMSINPFISNAFILQILFLILAPTLIAAAISLTFKHLVLYYGPQYSTIRPRLYPWVFVGSDFVSIVIQGIGGAVAASASTGDDPDPKKADLGNNLLIAGVSFQVVNMVVCGALMLIYIHRYRNARKSGTYASDFGEDGIISSDSTNPPSTSHRTAQSDKRVKQFIFSLTVAYVAIIVRCIYRIPEMASGWGSSIMRNEATFMVFDGAMILIAVLLLTIVHPLWFFPFLSTKPPGFGPPKKGLKHGSIEMEPQR